MEGFQTMACVGLSVTILFLVFESSAAASTYNVLRNTTTTAAVTSKVPAAAYTTTATTTTKAATTTTKATTAATTTGSGVTAGHHTYYGKTGHIQAFNYYTYRPTTDLYHIDNPDNNPVVIHFRSFSYADTNNCSRESLTFYPHDWPFDQNVLRFCGHSIPGNGHLYIPNLGSIESRKEAYSYSSFSFDYEILSVAYGNITTYKYPLTVTTPKAAAAAYTTTATTTTKAATTTTKATTAATTTGSGVTAGHHTYYGKTGHIQALNYYTYRPTTDLYHIDNPDNNPVVIHFRSFRYADTNNCSRESLTFYPHDWPFDQNVLRFCGHSIPGNGHLYIPNLGSIESRKEAYSYSSFSFDYEILSVGSTTPTYWRTTMPKPQLPKSRLLEMLRNMEQQLEALEGEAKFAYNLLNDSHINNLVKRSVLNVGHDGKEAASSQKDGEEN